MHWKLIKKLVNKKEKFAYFCNIFLDLYLRNIICQITWILDMSVIISVSSATSATIAILLNSAFWHYRTEEKMRNVTVRMEHFRTARTCTHAHTNTRVYTASHDVSRRSSRQILFRKIELPLSSTTERQQLCVGGSSRPTNTHVMCVRACVLERV